MEEMSLGSQILDKYGLIGLVVLFAGYVIKRVLDFLMANVDSKDKANREQGDKFTGSVNQLGEKFANSLDGNTKALNDLHGSVLKLTDVSTNIVAGFDRMAAQNREEHADILEHVRGTSEQEPTERRAAAR